jgi:hypothetical protein
MTTTAQPDVLDGAAAEYRECLEVRRLLGYLWTATGYRNDNLRVRDLFADDDPIVSDVERLAIFPEETI